MKIIMCSVAMTFLAILPAMADTRASFACDHGTSFTMHFSSANDFREATMVFTGSPALIHMINQNAESGRQYAGTGWIYREWQGKVTLSTMGKPRKPTSVKKCSDQECHSMDYR